MVTNTSDSSSNHHSPSSTPTTSADADSPKFPRKNLPSPWAQVVRGSDSEALSAINQSPPSSSPATTVTDQPPSSSPNAAPPPDSSNSNAAAAAVVDSPDADKGNNAGHTQKPAWKRPSEVSAVNVMGAVSWPPLSESTKPSFKLTPDSSPSKNVSDGSLSTPQGTVTSHSPHKQGTGNAKPNPASNHGMHNRQRSMKRGGSNSNSIGPAQSSFTNPSPPPPPPPPPFPVLHIPPGTFGNGVPGVPDPSPRDLYRSNNWDTRPVVGGFVPPMNEQRSSSRRGHFGHHPRGDGSYHNNNYGSRRDQDRGNYGNNRDAHVHQQRMHPRGLIRPSPPNTAAFMGPQPMRPFANPVGFPEFYYFPTLQFEPFGGMPFFTHGPPPAMFFPVAETPLTNMIVNQIDYYFSDANLVKDEYLRSNMDEQGWVPISLIATFPRVRSLTSNIELILDSLRTSPVVEVQGDKLRRRNEWRNWLPSAQRLADAGSVSPGGSSYNNPAADFEKITLDEAATDKVNSDPTTTGDAAGESSSRSQLPNGDATGNSN